MTLNNVLPVIEKARDEGNNVLVLATGVFDVLHNEHTRFLQAAKNCGDFLVVGLESDVRVKKLKGDSRPIHSQHDRVANLSSLGIADIVFILPEKFDDPQDHKNLISQIHPDIFAVSSHTNHLDKKRAIVESFGGQLKVVLDHNPELSTTKIVEKSL